MTTSYLVDMTCVTCVRCGMSFAVPDEWLYARKVDRAQFCCPQGHPLVFGSSLVEIEEQKRKEAEAERTRLQARVNELAHSVEVQKRSLDKERQATKRLKQRVAAGVCPCCNRTFTNLAEHMAGQHAEFQLEAGLHKKQLTAAKKR